MELRYREFASFLLTIVFFAVTQAVTARDAWALGIGAIFGAFVSAFVATFVFHSDSRGSAIAAEKAAISRKLTLIEALPTRAQARRELTISVAQLDEEAARRHGQIEGFKKKAEESRYQGFHSDAANEEGESNAALHATNGIRAQRDLDKTELARLETMSDDDYLSEQRHLRGLD